MGSAVDDDIIFSPRVRRWGRWIAFLNPTILMTLVLFVPGSQNQWFLLVAGVTALGVWVGATFLAFSPTWAGFPGLILGFLGGAFAAVLWYLVVDRMGVHGAGLTDTTPP